MENLTPIKAIRMYCVKDCCAGSTRDVRECQSENCPLFLYRMGKNPKRIGKGGNPLIKKNGNVYREGILKNVNKRNDK